VSIERAEEEFLLTAYQVSESPLSLEVAPARRAWMEETRDRFALRCLPLLMANRTWSITTRVPFRVLWDGRASDDALTIESLSTSTSALPCISHFGHGILTFHLPWLFRTPPGVELLIRGPINEPKDGAAALEGIVETDWAVATATMNWQITRPHAWVAWEAGETVATLLPVRLSELEQWHVCISPLSADPIVQEQYRAWARSRDTFLDDLEHFRGEAARILWQKDYVHGTSPGGASAPPGAHRTQRHMCPIEHGMTVQEEASRW
jgi:hypothetical protein